MLKNLFLLIVLFGGSSLFAKGNCYVQVAGKIGERGYQIRAENIDLPGTGPSISYFSEDKKYELRLNYLETDRFDAQVFQQGAFVVSTVLLAIDTSFVWANTKTVLPSGEELVLWCYGRN